MSLAEQLADMWRVRDLRRKIGITLLLLTVCRIGVYVPLPGINVSKLREFIEGQGGIFGLMDMFSGGALANGAIFGLGVMPYISASIIFTLLANVIPSLERLRKEGASGQKRLNQYTRIATVFICFFQGALIARGIAAMRGGDFVGDGELLESRWLMYRFMLSSGFIMMAGTMFLMWIGEQIDEHGIGNGMSLIITIGILARLGPALRSASQAIHNAEDQQGVVIAFVLLAVLFIALVAGVVFITRGERRIPVQQQKHVRGPCVYGGQKHYLPLRVNQAGVMPIIFASSLLQFPAIIAQAVLSGGPSGWVRGVFQWITDALGSRTLSLTYIFAYGTLIFFFCYFWTAVMFNPKEMAENLQGYGSFIPGIRPGRRTADYLEGIMNRVTVAGSFFLVGIALLPMIVSTLPAARGVASFYGGTGILIVVGVTQDLVRRINDHLEMRRYSGFRAGAGGRRRSRRR